MKKYIFSGKMMGLAVLCISVLSGCAKEPVFVDAEWAGKEDFSQEETSETDFEAAAEVVSEQEEEQPVIVHVCGAVVNPGVYELSTGSRIADAVDMAGGFAEGADESYVNLAEIPADGQQIMIPTKEEAVILKQATDASGTGKVNINTADIALLCTLPGIGETRAGSIIEYRQKHGGFSAIEDIMQVSGIKESSFQKIKERIVVN